LASAISPSHAGENSFTGTAAGSRMITSWFSMNSRLPGQRRRAGHCRLPPPVAGSARRQPPGARLRARCSGTHSNTASSAACRAALIARS
jgi:hypothetical protein